LINAARLSILGIANLAHISSIICSLTIKTPSIQEYRELAARNGNLMVYQDYLKAPFWPNPPTNPPAALLATTRLALFLQIADVLVMIWKGGRLNLNTTGP
jgi:hypothetical protein